MLPKSRPIRLTGVRQNNLKNISVEIPSKKLCVITGLSGSGKSSLVFDTLYAEGQRRYIESLSTYTRQFLEKMPKPDLDFIENIPPAIALEQKNHVLNSRSTVGTQTEIVDYLRLLFAKIGKTFCIRCGGDVKQLNAESILNWAVEWLPGKKAMILAPLQLAANGTEKTKTTLKPATKSTAKATAKAVGRTSAAKEGKGGKSEKTNLLNLRQSLFQVLREQGFQRVLLKLSAKKIEVLDLQEVTEVPADFLSPETEIYAVVDRLRISGQPDADTRGRLLDSIDQALAIGHGKIIFYQMDAEVSSPSSGTADKSDESTQQRTSTWNRFDQRFSCTQCGLEHRVPEPHFFSFNSPLGACSKCSGFGFTLDLDESLVIPDPSKTLKNGAIDPFSKPSFSEWQADLFRFAERHGISIGKRYHELTADQKQILWNGFPGDKTFAGINACFEELKRWKYKIHVRVFIRRYQSQSLCPDCKGMRLKKESLCVQVNGKSIGDVLAFAVKDALQWSRSLQLTKNERKLANEVFAQVDRRLAFLDEVGVGYLTLSRLTKTLSGGEFQRINLATQLGNGLCGTLYVLDEPSIGLHAADTDRLIRVIERLRDQGNSVVVVEHDLEMIRAADWLLELGPGAGKRGGDLVAQGTANELKKNSHSLTGKYLSGALKVAEKRICRGPTKKVIRLEGCQENNLRNLDVEFPLNRFVVVTGVSGSGKSTLVHTTLFRALARIYHKAPEAPGKFNRLYGADQLGGIALLDQTPIGKSSRSNPATYLKAWDEVRKIYANQVLSLRRGYSPQYFSFNVDGGRCPVCKGEGEITLDMHFMAEIRIPCEECNGRRFKKAVLDVTYKKKNIYDLLNTTIDEAYDLFRDNSVLVRKLGILRDVGLGYLLLGQSATTLSGGESQRLKIASTLDSQTDERLLYIFDEPTTGLHSDDIRKLLRVIQDLVDARHSVIMIEHQLDVIAQSDWVIDLGPGGGDNGGHLIARGTPARLMENDASITGVMLRKQGYG